MPVDIEKIKDAFGKFEDDDYVSAKEILTQEIGNAKNDFLTNKLGLAKKKVEAKETDETDETDEACGDDKKKKKKQPDQE